MLHALTTTTPYPTILAIDTSCDETSAAVTQGTKILSNIVWSQVSLHEKWGGVVPSVAQRAHEERIDRVVEKAIRKVKISHAISAVAVTSGPGLAIALGVGIKKAQDLARLWGVPLIEVNHIEGHMLSPLAQNYRLTENKISFPALGLVVSGGHTELVHIEAIGRYQILARTEDDALGEALDKAARILGLGYPGGAFLEKLAREGQHTTYPLPLPMAGREFKHAYSYSGLKAAMWRLVQTLGINEGLSKQQLHDLAAGFQFMAFKHLIRISRNSIDSLEKVPTNMLVGGGVAANVELRRQLRLLGKEKGVKVWFPQTKRLCGDNAGMIGIAAGFKYLRGEVLSGEAIAKADRRPRWSIDEVQYGYGSNTT